MEDSEQFVSEPSNSEPSDNEDSDQEEHQGEEAIIVSRRKMRERKVMMRKSWNLMRAVNLNLST